MKRGIHLSPEELLNEQITIEDPLPEDSEFWRLENVMITPHISGGTPHYADRVVKIFCENLARYLYGKPLINVVDKKAEY